MSALVNVTLLIFTLLAVANARKLPSYITQCRLRDPNLSVCLKNAAEQIRPQLKDGIPDMRIPPLEPLLIPSAVQDSGSAFRAYFKNISLYGLTSFKLTNFDFDVDTNTANLGLVFDALRGLGDYRIQGMLLVLQLDGGGKIDVTLNNVVIGAKLRGHRKEVKGKEYLVFDQNDFNVSVGGGKVYFADLFKGNPELTENTNKVINENVSVIIDELTPVIKSVLEQVILGTVLQLFERFSINELFTVND